MLSLFPCCMLRGLILSIRPGFRCPLEKTHSTARPRGHLHALGLCLWCEPRADESSTGFLQKCCFETAGERQRTPKVSAEFGFITRVFILMATLFFSRKKLSSNYLILLFYLWGYFGVYCCNLYGLLENSGPLILIICTGPHLVGGRKDLIITDIWPLK